MSVTKELQYEFTTQAAPVQAEGFIAGNPFYFRARHQHWSFAVSEDPSLDPVDIDNVNYEPNKSFFIEESFGQKAFDASWMPLEVANEIIQDCAMKYLQSRKYKSPND